MRLSYRHATLDLLADFNGPGKPLPWLNMYSSSAWMSLLAYDVAEAPATSPRVKARRWE